MVARSKKVDKGDFPEKSASRLRFFFSNFDPKKKGSIWFIASTIVIIACLVAIIVMICGMSSDQESGRQTQDPHQEVDSEETKVDDRSHEEDGLKTYGQETQPQQHISEEATGASIVQPSSRNTGSTNAQPSNNQTPVSPYVEPTCDEAKKIQYTTDFNTATTKEDVRYQLELEAVPVKARTEAHKTSSCSGGLQNSTFCGDKKRQLEDQYRGEVDATHQNIMDELTNNYINSLSSIRCN